MVTEIHPDLLFVLDSLELVSPSRFTLLGETFELQGVEKSREPEPLVELLKEELYSRLYIRPTPAQTSNGTAQEVDRDFLAALSGSNTGKGTWEPGWTIRRVEQQGWALVTRGEVIIRASGPELQSEAKPMQPGQPCRVRGPKEYCYLLKGYYLAMGDGRVSDVESLESTAGQAASPRVRFYWHLTRESAVPFVAQATALLNAAQVPFHLKVVRHPGGYHRADAGVLFLSRKDALTLGPSLLQLHESVVARLRGDVPLFTHKLADGLAIAEQPGGMQSFGEHRCALVARALWNAFLAGEFDRTTRAFRVASLFQEEGLDPCHPHLGPGSLPQSLALLEQVFATRTTSLSFPESTSSTLARDAGDAPKFLDAAMRIGEHLNRTAIWDHSGRCCNWVGRTARERVDGAIIPTAEALGPDLYEGSAGIALFLARLHCPTGDPSCRQTALGAATRSIEAIRMRPPRQISPLSFYCGQLGVACAGWRIAEILGDSYLATQALSLLEAVQSAPAHDHPLDVLGGHAGAIPALLSLSRSPELRLPAAQSLAICLGRQLCDAASRDGGSWTWNPQVASGPGAGSVPLSGMSHGASGIALALLELHAETAEPLFHEAARGALAYEDALFDRTASNWPDLRLDSTAADGSHSRTMARAWCHGAPGIALARLRAIELDPARAEVHRTMARAAIGTTLAAVDEALPRPGADTSLCHGLAGLLDILLLAGEQLGDPALIDRAAAAGRVLIDRQARALDYPSGLSSRALTPSLMLGLAGVGLTFLRLHDRDRVPSVLLPGAALG